LEANFKHKNVCKDLTIAMMITKVELCCGGESKRAISKDLGFLQFKTLFCQSAPTNHTKLAERCIWVSYNIPSDFKPKY